MFEGSRDENAGEVGEELFLLDEIARQGAQRMLMTALNGKPIATSNAIAVSATNKGTLW
jgi:hypothetical protein